MLCFIFSWVMIPDLHSDFCPLHCLRPLWLTCQLVLNYVDHVLKQILPPGLEVPSSFETIVKYSNYVVPLADLPVFFLYFCIRLMTSFANAFRFIIPCYVASTYLNSLVVWIPNF